MDIFQKEETTFADLVACWYLNTKMKPFEENVFLHCSGRNILIR
jgi:hypothetical protein